jgi:hypothetical protein
LYLLEENKMPLNRDIPKFEPTYCGDSVYARFDGYAFVIYTDNGMGPENEIYLEPSTLDSFISYTDKIAEQIKALQG